MARFEFFMLHIFSMINMAVASTISVAHKLGERNTTGCPWTVSSSPF